MSKPDCLFCRIAAGETAADVLHTSDRVVAFRDINPQAPVHFLVIPRRHIDSLADAPADAAPLLGDLLAVARDVAASEGIGATGYRTVINTAEHGGQTVGHLHVHVLGGRPLTWPPG